MGGLFSSFKLKNSNSNSNEVLLKEYSNSPYLDNQNNLNLNNQIKQIDILKYELNKLKEENKKYSVEIIALYDKNTRLESELNKIQNNYGKEIFSLNEMYSSIHKDTLTLLNNQKIISDVLNKLTNQESSIQTENYNSFLY